MVRLNANKTRRFNTVDIAGFLRATTPQEEKDKKEYHRLLDKSSKSSSTEENPCSSSFSFISDNSSCFLETRFLDKAEEITFADCNLEG